MSTDLKPRTGHETFHAGRAQRYEETIRRVIPGYDTLHAMAGFLLRQEVGEHGHVLAVGCGTGTELEVLGKAGPRWHLTACDPAQGMLDLARARVAGGGLTGRVHLHACTVDRLPDGLSFDAATCLLVLHFLPDDGAKAALLHAVAQRLKPGAPLVLADMYEDPASPRFSRLLAAWTRWQLEHGIAPAEVEKGLEHVRRDIHFVSEARLSALLEEAGFTPPERFFGAFLFGGYLAHRLGEGAA